MTAFPEPLDSESYSRSSSIKRQNSEQINNNLESKINSLERKILSLENTIMKLIRKLNTTEKQKTKSTNKTRKMIETLKKGPYNSMKYKKRSTNNIDQTI